MKKLSVSLSSPIVILVIAVVLISLMYGIIFHSSSRKTDSLKRALDVAGITSAPGPRLKDHETGLLEVSPDTLRANERSKILLTYTVGERQLSPDDRIWIQLYVSNFLDSSFPLWSHPQTMYPDSAGYIKIISDHGEKLSIQTSNFKFLNGLIGLKVTSRIPEGEKIVLSYRGRVQALARTIELKCYRNGRLLNKLPPVTILPDSASYVHTVLPSVTAGGERTTLSIAVLDRYGNLDTGFRGGLTFGCTDQLVEGLPPRYQFTPADSGLYSLEDLVFHSEGFQKVHIRMRDHEFESNPCRVTPGEPAMRVYFGDLHFHTGTVTDTMAYGLGDHRGGYSSEEGAYRYARDVMMLDFAAVTEHAYNPELQEFTTELWRRSQEISTAFYRSGLFTTLYGFEWHSSSDGHRVILYPVAGTPYYDCDDPRSNSVEELWDLLNGEDCLIIPHAMQKRMKERSHPLWRKRNNDLQLLGEIFSNKNVELHNPAEIQKFELAADEPHSMQFAWKNGHRVGVIAGSDDHFGHPGRNDYAETVIRTGGLTGVLSAKNDRENLWDSLKRRHTYATTGTRIYLELSVGEYVMGDLVQLNGSGDVSVHGLVAGTAPLEEVAIVQFDGSDFTPVMIPMSDARSSIDFSLPLSVKPGSMIYLRVKQKDGEMAWSSPIWFEGRGEEEAVFRLTSLTEYCKIIIQSMMEL